MLYLASTSPRRRELLQQIGLSFAVLKIDVDGKKYDIAITDWIYLVDDKTAINVSKMTKFWFNK